MYTRLPCQQLEARAIGKGDVRFGIKLIGSAFPEDTN